MSKSLLLVNEITEAVSFQMANLVMKQSLPLSDATIQTPMEYTVAFFPMWDAKTGQGALDGKTYG